MYIWWQNINYVQLQSNHNAFNLQNAHFIIFASLLCISESSANSKRLLTVPLIKPTLKLREPF